jgi:AcrR family transcriptional regulator
VAQQNQTNKTSGPEVSRRVARAYRILDAAGELTLRWGYQKTTLEDISRQAGVAKATIYLHWKTREELFEALMRREKLAMGAEMIQHIQDDPEGATLRGMLKQSALGVLKRPLLKALLLSDVQVLGKMAQSSHRTESYRERLTGFTTYLEFLRACGLVRTDLSIKEQVYTLSAIFIGFFLVALWMPDEYQFSDEALAELMARAIHSLEPENNVSAATLEHVSHRFLRYLEYSLTQAQAQFQSELEAEQSRREENSK